MHTPIFVAYVLESSMHIQLYHSTICSEILSEGFCSGVKWDYVTPSLGFLMPTVKLKQKDKKMNDEWLSVQNNRETGFKTHKTFSNV